MEGCHLAVHVHIRLLCMYLQVPEWPNVHLFKSSITNISLKLSWLRFKEDLAWLTLGPLALYQSACPDLCITIPSESFIIYRNFLPKMLVILCFFGDVFRFQDHRKHGNVQNAHAISHPLILNACISAFFLSIRVFHSIGTVQMLKRKVEINCKHFASDCKDCA